MRNLTRRPVFTAACLIVGACGPTPTDDHRQPAEVASVALSPGALALDVGESAQVTALVLDMGGAEMSGQSVDWTSADPGIAAVSTATSQTAEVTGVAEGSTVVHAEVSGFADTISVAITAPVQSQADECSAPASEWVWCDDFEQDRMASYFEVVDQSGSFVRASGVGVDGSFGMRARFTTGQVNAGALHLAVGRTPQAYMDPADAGTEDYRELYWRVYVRHQAGWIGGGGDKLSRAFIFASPTSWAQAMVGHVWSGGSASNWNYLVIDPASGTDTAGNLQTTAYNDNANFRWLGSDTGTTPIFDASHVGEWYCVEAQIRLNDAGSSNGIFRVWVDGSLEAELTDLNWVGAYNDYGLNAVFLENYWNKGSPQDQERYMDNFVVSTASIGCN